MPAVTAKPPTPQGISRLLKNAGCKRSERQIGGFSTGYVVGTDYRRADAVQVRHRFWSMGGGDATPHLAFYAEIITAAGWAVELTGLQAITVTAPEEEQ